MILPSGLSNVIPVAASHKEDYQTLDSTKLQSFLACPRQYFYEYVLGWRQERASNHLVFGQAWHSALEYLYNGHFSIEEVPQAFQRFLEVYRKSYPELTDTWFGGKTPDAALQALVEYMSQNAGDLYNYDVLATEITDSLPVTETQGLIVKLDAILEDRKTGKKVILEHKTGSSSGAYWARQWHLSIQVGAYISACNHFYNQTETECIIDGVFFLKTKRNFQRERVIRSDKSLRNWGTTVISAINSITSEFEVLSNEDGPENEVQLSFPQNPVSCEKYGGCQFWDLCTCVANPILLAQAPTPPIGFKEEWWNPLTA